MSNDTSQISEREREILRLVATGATNQQIAYQLNISINTVKVHLRNIFGKIGVASRTEATVYAVRNGLVQLSEAAVAAPTAVAEALPEEAEPLLARLDDADVFADTPDGSSARVDGTRRRVEPIVVVHPPAPTAARWPWLLGGGLLAALLIVSAVDTLRHPHQAAPIAHPQPRRQAAPTSRRQIRRTPLARRWRQCHPGDQGSRSPATTAITASISMSSAARRTAPSAISCCATSRAPTPGRR